MTPPPDSRHHFITFDFDTTTISAPVWMKLGEALSKCQHIGRAPVKPQLAAHLSAVYLARGVQGTTAIEGNTLTEQEVLEVVQKGTANTPESREYLEREVANILRAVEEIDEALQRGERLPIDRERLCRINYTVLDGIPDEPWVVPGELREVDVTAGPYLAPHWTEMPEMVERFTKWLNELRGSQTPDRSPEDRFVSAVLSAILAHLYIAWIHPFGNGNGRAARLVEVQILAESGVVPLVSTNLLSDFYNKTRTAYYRALNEAQRDVNAFVRYAVTGFLDELRSQINDIFEHNLQVQWESYVYGLFSDKPNTEARARQRLLALTLPGDRGVTPEEATDVTPPLARLYAVTGERTPARDMNDLRKMGLVVRVGPRRYRARRELMQAFIPPVST